MLKSLLAVHDVVWGTPAVCFILGVGLFLSAITAFPQIRLMPAAFLRLLKKPEQNNRSVTPIQALCTALGATVGTGNLVGVAGAICLGGPGAIFWMWVCGFIGMGTKFAETCLAVRYRVRSKDGYIGGPMYMISNGLGPRWCFLAYIYCFLALFAAMGVGNAVQINSVISGFNSVLRFVGARESETANLMMGMILAAIIGVLLLGGAKQIGVVCEKIVPWTAGGYILLCILFLIYQRAALHVALAAILKGAFHPRAFTGGIIGSVLKSVSVGCARGFFSNEAGTGTASIAHASAQVRHPVEQGMMGLLEVFIDTIVICTLTALVILCSGVPIPYGKDIGAALTIAAFCNVYGSWVSVVLSLLLCFFSVETIIGWGLYGERCSAFLLGNRGGKIFIILEMAAIVLGSVINTESVWMLAETVNGLLSVPNLIVLVALSPELIRITREYKCFT